MNGWINNSKDNVDHADFLMYTTSEKRDPYQRRQEQWVT